MGAGRIGNPTGPVSQPALSLGAGEMLEAALVTLALVLIWLWTAQPGR